MSIFTDNFDRANGALGGNWTTTGGAPDIAGTYAGGPTLCSAVNTTISDALRIKAAANVLWIAQADWVSPTVKASPLNGQCYYVKFTYAGGNYTVALWKGYFGWEVSLASITYAAPNTNYHHITLEWNAGHLTGSIDDVHYVEANDTMYGSNNYAGFMQYAAGRAINDITITTGTPPALSVSPAAIGNYGACSTVTLSGTGTAWTPGTPGAPNFTVDHGTISAQTVVDDHTASLTYCPGSYLGAVVFGDPSTGNSAGAIVTSDPIVAPPPGGSTLSDAAIAYIERSAAAQSDSVVLNRTETAEQPWGTFTVTETLTRMHQTLTQPGYPVDGTANLLALVIQVFDLLNGGSDWGGTATVFGNTSVIKSGVDDLATTLSEIQGPGGVSLAVLAAALSDLRGVGSPSIADVLASISGADNSAVLDAIAAARGSGNPSLATLVTSLSGLRTGSNYSLDSVKGWIDALPHGVDGPTAIAVVAFVAALALAIPTGGASVAAEAVAVGAGPLLDIATLVEVVSLISELASVATDIATIKSSLTTPTVVSAPVWPGDGLVTLGTSHALADGLIVDGPMHGLIVTISTHPSGAGVYSFSSVKSWQHCGAVIFANDLGHYERAESFGLEAQILTPRTMAAAASATVRLNSGWTGTIRPWTINA